MENFILLIFFSETSSEVMQHMFSIKYSGMMCYLTLGDKHNTNEFFLDPEFFLDLGELPRLDNEGELLFEHVAEDP